VGSPSLRARGRRRCLAESNTRQRRRRELALDLRERRRDRVVIVASQDERPDSGAEADENGGDEEK